MEFDERFRITGAVLTATPACEHTRSHQQPGSTSDVRG
jgi:hypothetical protein